MREREADSLEDLEFEGGKPKSASLGLRAEAKLAVGVGLSVTKIALPVESDVVTLLRFP